jgi:hypothetical protein
VVEHFLHTEGVAGSKPAARTIFTQENGEVAFRPKETQNVSEGFNEQTEVNVKFPKRLRYRDRGKVLATIYKSAHPSQPYTLYWRVRSDGKPGRTFLIMAIALVKVPEATIAGYCRRDTARVERLA